MEKQPKCKKCGRRLKSPLSITRGMGPKCAGIISTSGKSVRVRSQLSSGTVYTEKAPSQVHATLIPGEMLKETNEQKRLDSSAKGGTPPIV